jgi:hypothetical protein
MKCGYTEELLQLHVFTLVTADTMRGGNTAV